MKHFNFSFRALGLFCALSGVALAGCNSGGGVAGAGSSGETLANVGQAKVTRGDLYTFLEAQGGEQALPILIDTQLVFEALKAKSLDVTDAEVDADLKRRQAADPGVEQLLAGNPQRLPIIKNQIKREIAVQKLLTAGITPTEAQLKSFFEKNRRYYDQPSKTTVAMLLTSTKTRADLLAAQLKKKSKTVVQLVAEQKAAADPLGAQSVEDASQSQIFPQIAPRITPLTDKLSAGGVAPVQQFAPQAFGVFAVTKKTPVVKADLATIRAEVETDYKAAEVAKKVVAENPQNPPFDETLKRTFDALKTGGGQSPGNPNATLRDVLNSINQIPANKLISDLRTAGTVQVEDAAYAKVAAGYQAPAGATGNTATGNTATGNTATGNTATGNAASGNSATGNAASGNSATGNAAPAAANAAPATP